MTIKTRTSMLKRGKRKQASKDAAEDYARQLQLFRLPAFERELRFAHGLRLPEFPTGRDWRFDFAFPAYKVAVEIEGLVVKRIDGQCVVMGRHATITGIREDMVKYTNAAYLGWTVLRFEQAMVATRWALNMTMHLLESKGWKSGGLTT